MDSLSGVWGMKQRSFLFPVILLNQDKLSEIYENKSNIWEGGFFKGGKNGKKAELGI